MALDAYGPMRREVSWASLLRTTRVPYGFLALVAAGLLIPPQLKDMLAALTEPGHIGAAVAFPASMAFLAFCCWHWARASVSARFNLPDSAAAWDAAVEAGRRGKRPRLRRIPLLLVPQAPIPLAGVIGLGIALRSGAVWLGLATLLSAALLWAAIFGRQALQHLLRRHSPLPVPEAPQLPAERVELQSTGHFMTFARRVPARFATLLRRAPFGPGVATALLAASLLIFVVTATASFFPAHRLDDPRNLIWTVFEGPTPILVGCGFIVAPLTAMAFVLDGWRPSVRVFGVPVGLFRPPVMTALVAVSLAVPLFVNLHALRLLPGPVSQTRLADRWAAWQARCGPTARPVIVAISGGAARAALWGAAVLEQADRAAEGHDAAIFAISSVSGGSLGAAAYMAALAGDPSRSAQPPGAAACRRDPASDARFAEFARRLAAADAIGPLLAGFILSDVPRALLGWAPAMFGLVPGGGDRATAIERAFETHARDAAFGAKLPVLGFDTSYLALGAPGRPVWLANGTNRDSGRRTLTAPIDSADWPFSASGNLLRQLDADVAISTAVNNTARFSFIEPSGLSQSALTRDSGVSVIDGGYYDDSGLETALDLAHWLEARGASPVIVVATGAGTSGGYGNGMERRGTVGNTVVRCGVPPLNPDAPEPLRSMTDLLSPLIGLNGVREGHVEALLQRVAAGYCDPGRPRFFHFYLGPYGQDDVPLNWVLSRKVANHIWVSAGHDGGGDEAADPYVKANIAEAERLGAALSAAR